jgi:hypothetical protein
MMPAACRTLHPHPNTVVFEEIVLGCGCRVLHAAGIIGSLQTKDERKNNTADGLFLVNG